MNDGGYIVVGSFWLDSLSDKVEDNIGIGLDYWVMKFDVNGVIIWENIIGGDGIDRFGELIKVNDGGYILVGMLYFDIFGDKIENSIGVGWEFDFWLVKINESGEVVWDKIIGGNLFDEFVDIELINNGYIMGGYF